MAIIKQVTGVKLARAVELLPTVEAAAIRSKRRLHREQVAQAKGRLKQADPAQVTTIKALAQVVADLATTQAHIENLLLDILGDPTPIEEV